MWSVSASLRNHSKLLAWTGGVGGFLLLWMAIAVPNLNRVAGPADKARRMQSQEVATSLFTDTQVGGIRDKTSTESEARMPIGGQSEAAAVRKMIRTSSVEMVVRHPAESASEIERLAGRLGGFLENSSGRSQDAGGWRMTIRVPAAQFDEARVEIRKLGLRVESERVEAQDVTLQYVDQEANLRNLRAEEAQYLAILKQAGTVKDMLAVSQKLSEVRGQIERQQAEFNALSKQVETVAITISLRAEEEARVFGLNWRPLYQLKVALRDGLESIASYAAVMVSILFYLPAVLLWVGTILVGVAGGWKLVRWVGRRIFGWQSTVVQNG